MVKPCDKPENHHHAVNPDSFVKHDAGKGCSPSLIPISFRRGVRKINEDHHWQASVLRQVYECVEMYEVDGDLHHLHGAGYHLARTYYASVAHFFWGIAEVYDMGAKKYSRNNWAKCDYEERYRYVDALYRHLLAMEMQQEFDDESGKPHAAHAGCCLGMLEGLETIHRAKQEQGAAKLRHPAKSLTLNDVAQSDAVRNYHIQKMVEAIGKDVADKDRVVAEMNRARLEEDKYDKHG